MDSASDSDPEDFRSYLNTSTKNKNMKTIKRKYFYSLITYSYYSYYSLECGSTYAAKKR